jgi:hypothetical protein
MTYMATEAVDFINKLRIIKGRTPVFGHFRQGWRPPRGLASGRHRPSPQHGVDPNGFMHMIQATPQCLRHGREKPWRPCVHRGIGSAGSSFRAANNEKPGGPLAQPPPGRCHLNHEHATRVSARGSRRRPVKTNLPSGHDSH